MAGRFLDKSSNGTQTKSEPASKNAASNGLHDVQKREEILSRPVASLRLPLLPENTARSVIAILEKNNITTIGGIAELWGEELLRETMMSSDMIAAIKSELSSLGVPLDYNARSQQREHNGQPTDKYIPSEPDAAQAGCQEAERDDAPEHDIRKRPISTMILPGLEELMRESKIRALYSCGIRYIGDLTQLSERQVHRIRGIGPKTVEAIKAELSSYGLRLAEEDYRPPVQLDERMIEILRRPVCDLGLPSRAHKAASSNAVYTYELIQMTEDSLLRQYGVGAGTVKDMKDTLEGMGLSFGMVLDEKILDRLREPASLGSGEEQLENLLRPVHELRLTLKGSNDVQALARYVFELVEKTESDLYCEELVGPRTVREIKGALAGMGLSLGMKLDDGIKARLMESVEHEEGILRIDGRTVQIPTQTASDVCGEQEMEVLRELGLDPGTMPVVTSEMLAGRSMGQYFDDLEAALLRQAGPPKISIGTTRYFSSTFPKEELDEVIRGSQQEIARLSEIVKEDALTNMSAVVSVMDGLSKGGGFGFKGSLREFQQIIRDAKREIRKLRDTLKEVELGRTERLLDSIEVSHQTN